MHLHVSCGYTLCIEFYFTDIIFIIITCMTRTKWISVSLIDDKRSHCYVYNC